MKFVYVLEDESRFQEEILQAILQVDPKIQIRMFLTLESFAEWLRLAMIEGSAAISKGGIAFPGIVQEPLVEEEHRLVLVISKIEFLGVKQVNLLRKTRQLFIDRNICTKEDPTSFVLTAFDDPKFKARELEDRILSNVIFKPFDRLILLQHLTFAIDGRHPASKYTIQNQKQTSVIEMLKSAPMEAVSEVGFLTVSEKPIDVGQVAKYYGQAFATERHKSLIGVCASCDPHPTLENHFQVEIRYFAVDPVQISNSRKGVRKTDAPLIPVTPKAVPLLAEAEIVILDPEEKGSAGIGGALERRFGGVKIVHYGTFSEFLYDLDPAQRLNQKDVPRAFEGNTEVSFEVDHPAGILVAATQGDGAPVLKIFGFSESDWKGKSNWLYRMLDRKSQEKWRRLHRIEGLENSDDPYFNFKIGEKDILLKYGVRDKKKNGNWLFKFSDTSKEEIVSYLTKNSKLPQRPVAVFISHRFFGESPAERWKFILDLFAKRGAKPLLFLLSIQEFSDAQEREMANYLADIFYKPVDRSYLAAKFHSFFPGLSIIGDPIEIKYVRNDERLKVANPVTIKEFSEAGFVMEYYRPISIGSFREMVLWQPYEIGAPELMANCNYTEEVQGKKGVFHNHFVLFGMHDYFLKSIRVWIRNNYIMSKDNSGS